MKRLIFSLALLFNLSHASGTYDGIFFSDSEEKASLFLCNYMPYQDFINITFTSTYATSVLSGRPYSTFSDCANHAGMTSDTTKRLWEYSHFVEIQYPLNELGIIDRDKNFLMALSAILIGFAFLFFLLYTVVKIATRRGY